MWRTARAYCWRTRPWTAWLDCLGEDQGWALIMTDQLPRIKEDLRFDHLSVDH